MSNYDEVMKSLGVEIENEIVVENTGSQRYEFKDGVYSALVGDLRYKYVDVEGKTCEKTDPGARLGYAQQDFLIIQAPDKTVFVTSEFKLNPDLPPSAFRYSSFISLDSDRQYQNKRFYESFFIENQPPLNVVVEEKNTFKINFTVLKIYRGCPCKLNFETKTSKKGRKYQQVSVELDSHKIDKDTLAQRNKIVDVLYKEIDNRWELLKAEKDNEPSMPSATPSEDSIDDIMGKYV